jgi:hypothetical protein
MTQMEQAYKQNKHQFTHDERILLEHRHGFMEKPILPYADIKEQYNIATDSRRLYAKKFDAKQKLSWLVKYPDYQFSDLPKQVIKVAYSESGDFELDAGNIRIIVERK